VRKARKTKDTVLGGKGLGHHTIFSGGLVRDKMSEGNKFRRAKRVKD
jgi:hypothetical protein